MALFARNFYGNDDVSFAPFFRFVDALDSHHSNKQRGGLKAASVFRPSFNPKFDVVETKTAYELHGEIPGAERKDISIDFTEPQTIVVRGRVERQRTEGTNPAEADAAAKDSTTTAVAESVTTEAPSEKTPPSSPSLSAHRATVTDEETEAASERGELTEEDRQQVAAPAPAAVAQKKEAPKAKYWFQERSIGEFSRTFSFPVPVDEEAVKASLNNGVLRVTIPKQEKRSNRRVVIA